MTHVDVYPSDGVQDRSPIPVTPATHLQSNQSPGARREGGPAGEIVVENGEGTLLGDRIPDPYMKSTRDRSLGSLSGSPGVCTGTHQLPPRRLPPPPKTRGARDAAADGLAPKAW